MQRYKTSNNVQFKIVWLRERGQAVVKVPQDAPPIYGSRRSSPQNS